MSEPVPNEGMWTGGGRRGPRPKLSIPYSRLEVCCEIVAAVGMISIAVHLFAIWTKLPAQIPIHFNIMGQADRWGSRNSIIPLFGVMVALYAGLSLLQRFPHIYNYAFGLTRENVYRQYQLARQLLTLIKTEIVCLFVLLQWGILHVAYGRSQSLGLWFTPVMIFVILITVVYYCVRAYKAR